jgi:hypothetical protein
MQGEVKIIKIILIKFINRKFCKNNEKTII